MNTQDVPQDRNSTYGGCRKLLYAVGPGGEYSGVPSAGWEVETQATRDALAELERLKTDALQRATAGACSPLEYHMYAARMDLALLAQVTGLWQWRVRRHLASTERFRRLPQRLLQRYADALDLPPDSLLQLPSVAPNPESA